jgi:hypothetical protein
MLLPECQPITFSFGLLETALEEVRDALKSWYPQQGASCELVPAAGALPGLLRQLEPLSAPLFKRVWVKVASSRWRTAYFDGFINGGDPFPPVSYLSARLGSHGVVVTSQPDASPCYGANKLELYGPRDTEWLNMEWSVAAFNDGGRWVWRHFGTEQPFEEPEAYTRRKVEDRFTAETTLLRGAGDPARARRVRC